MSDFISNHLKGARYISDVSMELFLTEGNSATRVLVSKFVIARVTKQLKKFLGRGYDEGCVLLVSGDNKSGKSRTIDMLGLSVLADKNCSLSIVNDSDAFLKVDTESDLYEGDKKPLVERLALQVYEYIDTNAITHIFQMDNISSEDVLMLIPNIALSLSRNATFVIHEPSFTSENAFKMYMDNLVTLAKSYNAIIICEVSGSKYDSIIDSFSNPAIRRLKLSNSNPIFNFNKLEIRLEEALIENSLTIVKDVNNK